MADHWLVIGEFDATGSLRDGGGRPLNFTKRMIPLSDDQETSSPPIMTVLIILINCCIFILWQQRIGLETSVQLAALVPVELTGREPGAITHLWTSMFMHGSWMHLIGNMWFLWIFGSNIEDSCGHVSFVLFYLLCGIIATGAHVLAEPNSTIPLVGASGAISGVLGAYLLKHPQARVRTLVPMGIFTRILEIPAFAFLLIWIGLQVFSQAAARGGGESSGVAYLAHIGGFVAGMALIFLFDNRNAKPKAPRWD